MKPVTLSLVNNPNIPRIPKLPLGQPWSKGQSQQTSRVNPADYTGCTQMYAGRTPLDQEVEGLTTYVQPSIWYAQRTHLVTSTSY